MSEDNNRSITPSTGDFFSGITNRFKLILRLLADRRVSPLLKLLPIGSLLYMFFFPDLMIGPIDDAAVISFGLYLFVELSPNHVVQEHMDELTNVITGQWRELDDEE